MPDVTQILQAVGRGDASASDELLSAVYDDLRKLAASKLAHEPPGQTLQATALVHEAFLRLIGNEQQEWDHRGHFFMAAAEAMRRILVDNARKKQAIKRGGDLKRADMELDRIDSPQEDQELLALHEALTLFEQKDPRAAQLVKLRYFTGLTIEQSAEMLEISVATANRDWTYARSWLHNAIRDNSSES